MILGIVPARGGSKGLAGKNLRPLGGLPLVVHTIQAARASALLSDVVVSTDDPAIAEVARGAGAKVPFLRPADLATDTIAVWPAVRHAVEHWEAATPGVELEAVVLLQPTSPLRSAEDIDTCIARFREHEAEICVTVVVPHDSPYFNMVQITTDTAPFARPCSPIMREHARRQDAPSVYALNGAVYVVARPALAALENQFQLTRYAVSEMPRRRSVDIDSLEDLELAEWLLAREARP